MPRIAAWSFALAMPLALWVAACGDSPDSQFDGGTDPTNNNGDDGGGGVVPHLGGEGGLGGDSGNNLPPCVDGLCTQQVACAGSAHTTVSGTVFDPAGNTPLYNVLVYVPNHPDKVAAITHGASCDRCGSVSGDPLVSTITDTKGKFTLTDVPVGKDIPVIIQVGKWRRQLKLPNVAQCVDNPITDVTQTRLPKNQQEGDIPKIAITTGGADSLECFLRSSKLGLDEKEFTLPGGGGSVNFYQGISGAGQFETVGKDPTIDPTSANKPFPTAQSFWADQNQLMAYDMVLLSCEGSSTNAPQTQNKGQAAYDAMYQYGSAGGRIFATHWHYIWFSGEPALNPAGTPWKGDGPGGNMDPGNPADGVVNDSFPKGQAFRDWLVNVSASTTPDHISIGQPKYNVDSTSSAATTWITMNNHTAYMTVNLPYAASDDKICGRAVYSDLHIGGATDSKGNQDTPSGVWPDGCKTSGMSAQEKALEFLLFDLSSCVQNDTKPPTPPPPGVK